jgi:diketogulonate reductase-like aldo/keto reductase
MRTIRLPDGRGVPALGLGTWRMGERPARRDDEVAALRRGLDLGGEYGPTLIDTAEMYGEGEAEKIVGEAMAGRRDEVFLVSKVYPHNADSAGVEAALSRSLERLRTDRIDLYLLHWRGSVPLAETIEAFERARADGRIGAWGVSNFDVDDMEELFEAGGTACATNQVLFNIADRGIEYDLLPWMKERGMPLMAYSPLGQGELPETGLADIARKHGASVFQIALAFVLSRENVIAIPKSADLAHLEQNFGALKIFLDDADLFKLDERFPFPDRKQPLSIL